MCMGHVIEVKGSCHRYERAMSQLWKGHVTDMNEPCHRHRGTSQAWMRHVTDMNGSRHTYEWVMPQSRMERDDVTDVIL